ncbi:MAG TPA: hypothetical protein VGC32_21020 [Solirubrobacterales bacterium]
MPFSKSKTSRSPLQRLSDSRRSVVLGGLAVGAVFSAVVLRRKRRGGEAEFEAPVAPSARADSGPPAAVVVPVPASGPAATDPEPDPIDVSAAESGATTAAEPAGAAVAAEPADDADDTAINAGTPAAGASVEAADAPTDEPPASTDPATGELNAEEASILAVLAQNGRIDEDRTAIAVATSLERETTDVSAVLRKLGSEGVVSGELYTATGDKIWAVTERGVRRLGAQN